MDNNAADISMHSSRKPFGLPNLPKFDIQKAIDYPRSDFDSDSVEQPPDAKKDEGMNVVENRIDQILAQGGLEVDSQGSFHDILHEEIQISDRAGVPPGQSLANELITAGNENQAPQDKMKNLLTQVNTFILDEEDIDAQLKDLGVARPSAGSKNKKIPPATNVIEYKETPTQFDGVLDDLRDNTTS